MCDYVMENVLEEEEEEEEPESEEEVFSQAEALNNKRLLLAGFLKLIIYSVFETTVAAPVFGQYIKVRVSSLVVQQVTLVCLITAFSEFW